MTLKKTHSFTIEHALDGEVVSGLFTARRLSIMDMQKMKVRTAQLCGGLHCVRDDDGKETGQGVDPETETFASMIAHLELVLEQRPAWFDLSAISSADADLLHKVYEEVANFEISFRRRGRPDAGASTDEPTGGRGGRKGGDEDRGPSDPKSDRGRRAQEVGDPDVRAALDA